MVLAQAFKQEVRLELFYNDYSGKTICILGTFSKTFSVDPTSVLFLPMRAGLPSDCQRV